ncbi:tetratricopeptide repeat protein [Granulosicoccus antarcticus]|uniref:Lipopolysaccharide assembly protein B n=1 Tax=Granulosicoccus antarcticus IMCC3135 TaxID=1192854 RepID=A0A2Z2P5T9_9GAMM|nr:tetratricopeptide repeat protein [Granulosicoccus antarcticus]ASJ75194.1 Lipopolysaccharide assembly protein B [Granulosicoccus antarcticus IMCC3135]
MSIPDLLWLLLPVAAVAGWFAAKRSDAKRPDAFWDYTNNFHQGLNVLLSEQQGKALELFDDLSGTSRDTADTHIALGNLYRRRGEVERAILLHQSVIDKVALPEDIRETARFELARDYGSAGLLDRSEHVLHELLGSEHRRGDAYDSLLQLHEQEQDWEQAIAVAIEFEKNTGNNARARIAHYYCERAVLAQKQQQTASAAEFLEKARRHHPQCARALMMQASMALEAGDHDLSLTLYGQVESLRPELMPEIIDSRFAALKAANQPLQLLAFVKRIHEQKNAYSVIRSTRAVIAELHSSEAADRFFKDQILKRPSLKGLRDWVHDQVALSKPGERDKVQVICGLLDQVVEDKPAYRCNSCGFQGNVMHWRCPSCGQWDSVSTIIGVEGE